MAFSRGSSYQRVSDVDYDFCCTRCDEDNKNTEALFYCTNCCKFYCDPCVKLHEALYTEGHSVLDRKNVDKWGVVRREVAMPMCDEHEGEELKMFCKDHDMVCCLTCISEDHRSCKNVQHVAKMAKDIQQMKDFKKLPAEVSNVIQHLGNMQDNREKTHQLLLDVCQDVITSLNELRKKLTKHMDEIQKRTLEQMNQLFAAMGVNIQSDKDTCKTKQDELKRLLEDIQTKGKNSENFAFSGFKKCRGKLSAAEGILQSMAKQDYKLTFTPDTSIEQCLSTMSTYGEFTTSTRIPTASTSPVMTDHVYTMVNKKNYNVNMKSDRGAASTSPVMTDHVYTIVNTQKYNVKIKSDESTCDIRGCCTLPNGNTVIVDYMNSKVKLLNRKYEVQANRYLPDYPRNICHIADSEVAVTVCRHWISKYEIQFLKIANGKLSLTKHIKMNHACLGLAHHAGQLYVGSDTALYIYTMTGQLVRKLYEDTSGGVTVCRFAVSDDGRMVYVSDDSHHTLITLDNSGNKLATLVDPDLKNPGGVHISHDGSVFVCGFGSNNVIQAAADGKRKIATLARQADGINKPICLFLDSKSSTLIAGQLNNNEILVLKIK